jgi:hypothetical protein
VLDHPGDGTASGTNAVTFVTLGQNGTSNHKVLVEVTGGATVEWHWADGTTTVGAGPWTHSFTNSGEFWHTNYVTVDPPSALVTFGTTLNWNDAVIPYVAGLSNFSALAHLWLWDVGLVKLDLTGCAALTDVKLAGNPETQEASDAWANEVAGSATGVGTFYYNDPGPGCWAASHGIFNTPSESALNNLRAKGWSTQAWCP